MIAANTSPPMPPNLDPRPAHRAKDARNLPAVNGQEVSSELLLRKPQFLEGSMTRLGMVLTLVSLVAGFFGWVVPTEELKALAQWASDNWETLGVAVGLLVAAYGKVRRNWRGGSAALLICATSLATQSLSDPATAQGTMAAVRVVAARIVASLLLMCCLCQCVFAKGTGYAFAALGTDAEELQASAEKLVIKKMVNSTALKEVAALVKKLWNSYLTLKGLEFVTGKYYDHAGREVDAATNLKLEELRNANSVEMGNLKLKELELMHAAEAAAPTA